MAETQEAVRGDVIREMDEAYGALRSAFAGLDAAALSETWLGVWGVREILTHISGWHREMLPALERLGRGAPAHPEGVSYDDFDAWNARFVAARAGATPAAVVEELEASHRAFAAGVARLPAALLAPGGAARELVDGVGAQHYREHADQIARWRRERGR